jgi:hypothetical protein
MIKDGNETDVDCGGGPFMGAAACSPCGDGKMCKFGDDCVDKVCGLPDGGTTDGGTTGTCQAPTCSDGVQNGTETDLDCGGSCAMAPTNKTCGVDKGCLMATDCTTGFCNNNKCATKADGQMCNGNGDCTNANCVMNICCHTACPPTAMNTCGSIGQCLPNGSACKDWPNTTMCSAGSCNMSTYTAPSNCDGMGMCPAGAQTNCATLMKVCNMAKGCVQCNGNTDCPAATCNGTVVTPAATCNASNNCVAGGMVDCSTMPATPVCANAIGCVQCNTSTDCMGLDGGVGMDGGMEGGTPSCVNHMCM